MAFPSDQNLALWESRELSHLQPWTVNFLITINSYFTALEISCHVCVYCIKLRLLSHTHQFAICSIIRENKKHKCYCFIFRTICVEKFEPVHSGHCQEMCWKIAPEVVYFLDDSLKCRCNFCRKHITNLFVSSQKMAYFLEYTGCDDILSLKISHAAHGIVYCWSFFNIVNFFWIFRLCEGMFALKTSHAMLELCIVQ